MFQKNSKWKLKFIDTYIINTVQNVKLLQIKKINDNESVL